MYICLDIDHFIIILITKNNKQFTMVDKLLININNLIYTICAIRAFLLVYIFGGVFYFPVIQVLFCQLIFTAHAFVL